MGSSTRKSPPASHLHIAKRLEQLGPHTMQDLARKLGLTPGQTDGRLRRAAAAGLVLRIARQHCTVWFAPGQEAAARKKHAAIRRALLEAQSERPRPQEPPPAPPAPPAAPPPDMRSPQVAQRRCPTEQALLDRLRALQGHPRTARELAYMLTMDVHQVEQALMRLYQAGLAHQKPGAWVEAGEPEAIVEICTTSLRGRGRTEKLVSKRGPQGQWRWVDSSGNEWESLQHKQLVMTLKSGPQEKSQATISPEVLS